MKTIRELIKERWIKVRIGGTISQRGLTFSTSKTISMTFRKRKKRNEEPLEIKLRNETIPFKESTQFLGMTLDSRLNWEEHINNLKAKAKRALN